MSPTWDERGRRESARFEARPWRTGTKWLLVVVAVCCALGLLFGVVGWVGGWFSEAKHVTGPANVSAQYAAVTEDWQAMISSAQNACNAVRASSQPGDPKLIEDPAFAYGATFRNARTDYNRRQQNIFEARAVGPRGYPRTVSPFPQESRTPIGSGWCEIAAALVAQHP